MCIINEITPPKRSSVFWDCSKQCTPPNPVLRKPLFPPAIGSVVDSLLDTPNPTRKNDSMICAMVRSWVASGLEPPRGHAGNQICHLKPIEPCHSTNLLWNMLWTLHGCTIVIVRFVHVYRSSLAKSRIGRCAPWGTMW